KGSFTVNVTASDGAISSTQSFAVSVGNSAPVLSAIGDRQLSPSQSTTIALSASDPNGDALTYSARVVSGSPTTPTPTLSFTGNQMTLRAPTNFKGSFVVEVTASDGSLTAKQSFTVSVPNVAPTLAPIANQSVAAGRSLTVPLSVGDVNGDAITL